MFQTDVTVKWAWIKGIKDVCLVFTAEEGQCFTRILTGVSQDFIFPDSL